jgi:RimJ/RimL family protein N-acetyltransferase
MVDKWDYGTNVSPNITYDPVVTLRPASDEDKWWVWENRNTDFIRRNSLNQGMISRDNHVRWWAGRNIDLREIWIAEIKKTEELPDPRVGCVILAYNKSKKNSVELSLWLKEEFARRGYGSRILKSMWEFIRYRRIGAIEACVMDHNYRSLTMFIRNGYNIVGRETFDKGDKELSVLFHLEKRAGM